MPNQQEEPHTFEEQISVHYKAHKGIMGHAFYLTLTQPTKPIVRMKWWVR